MEQSKQQFKNTLKLLTFGILLYCLIQNYRIVFHAIGTILNLLSPFLIGGVIAFIINVPMRAIERRLLINCRKFDKFRRVCAYLLTLILIIGIFALALFVIIPEIGNTIMIIIAQVPGAFANFQKWIYEITADIPNVQSYLNDLDLDWAKISSHAVNIIKTASTTLISSSFSIVSSLIGGVTTFVISFTFSIYLVFQKEKLASQLKQILYALCKDKIADYLIHVGRLSNNIFSSFLSGQCIEAVILGTMFFCVLSILQLPYALLIGVVIAITALIPIFGAFIGCAVGVFLIVMVNPIQALWFVIIFLILQQIEGNLIYPHVVGGSIGLPSIWVLAAVSLGCSLFGIAGILLFIPLCSVLYSLLRSFVKNRLRQKGVSSDKWAIVTNTNVPLNEESEPDAAPDDTSCNQENEEDSSIDAEDTENQQDSANSSTNESETN